MISSSTDRALLCLALAALAVSAATAQDAVQPAAEDAALPPPPAAPVPAEPASPAVPEAPPPADGAPPPPPPEAPAPTTQAPPISTPRAAAEAEVPARPAAQRAASAEKALPAEPEPAPKLDSDGVPISTQGLLFDVGEYEVRAFGFVQAQYQNFAVSEDELSIDGVGLLNQTGFALPRARAIVEGRNAWSALALEYDVANLGTNRSGVQRAEATLHYVDKASYAPFVALTLGMFRTPFGNEAAQSARVRLWMENATVTQAFFPGQSDIGARAQGSLGWFRYALAYVNGNPINEPRFGGFNPLAQGDALGRLGVDTRLGDTCRVVAGASLLAGRGFSPGSAPTKDTIVVRDLSESGIVTAQSIVLIQGQAAVPSRTFRRWGAGADVELSLRILPLWQVHLRGEVMFGSNLDRGLFISDPIRSGFNLRSYGAIGALETLVLDVVWLGGRYDLYEPNADANTHVGGEVVPVARDVTTVSGLVGLQLPGTLTRLLAQYDRVWDHLGLGMEGKPADLRNDRFTLRLQVSL